MILRQAQDRPFGTFDRLSAGRLRAEVIFRGLVFVMACGCVWAAGGDMGVGTDPNTDGSEAYPWLIEDIDDFDTFAGDPNYWAAGVNTHLMTGIDLSGRTYTTAVIAPNPRGLSEYTGIPFEGTFDGNHHEIEHLLVDTNQTFNEFIGLFGKIGSQGEVKAVTLSQLTIYGALSIRTIGGFCGINEGALRDCTADGIITGNPNISRHIGGACGQNLTTGIIDNCRVNATISGCDYIGGICGYNYYGSIQDCEFSGSVSGTQAAVGGICAYNSYGSIADSNSIGSVVGEASCGGIAGSNNRGSIIACRSSMTVDGRNALGGLCGYNFFGAIRDSFASGNVTGTVWSQHLGGLCGENYTSEIYHSGAAGDVVTGNNSSAVGGLCGYNCNQSTILDCYATGDIFSGTNSHGLGGLCGANYPDVNPNDHSVISRCYAIGHIQTGDQSTKVGGLCGVNSSKVIDCYATGSLTCGNDAYNLGGFIGYSTNYTARCYSTGTIIAGAGSHDIGGMCGSSVNTFSSCYWDINTSNITTSDGGTGKTTLYMMIRSTFSTWDFDPDDGDPADWMMLREGEDYPRLAWQIVYEGDIAGLYGVDMADFVYLSNYWGLDDCGGADDCGRSDIDESGDVGMGDLVIVAGDWLCQ